MNVSNRPILLNIEDHKPSTIFNNILTFIYSI